MLQPASLPRLTAKEIIEIVNINFNQLKTRLIDLANQSPSYLDIYKRTLFEQVECSVQKLKIDDFLHQLELISITIVLFEKQIISQEQLIDFMGFEFNQHLKSLGDAFPDQIKSFKSSIICSYSEVAGNLDIDLFKIVTSNMRTVQNVLETVRSQGYSIGELLLSGARGFFEPPSITKNGGATRQDSSKQAPVAK